MATFGTDSFSDRGVKVAPLLNSVKHGATSDVLGTWMYRSTISTSTHPCCLFLWERAAGTDWKGFGWAPEPVWTVWSGLKFVKLRTRTSKLPVVQPAGNRYTDLATVAYFTDVRNYKFTLIQFNS
jgi:hypothetical protein